MDDTNSIVGVQISNAKKSAIQDSINEITPNLYCPIYTVDVDGKEVTVIEIASGPQKPYVLSGAIYVRIGPNSQKLTTVEEMRNFFQLSDRIYFDEAPCYKFELGHDLDLDFLKEFRTSANLSVEVSDKQVLSNLMVYYSKDVFKNGATLFFGKHPEHFYETAVIRCVAFEGDGKTYIIDDKTYGGPLYHQYTQSMRWLKNNLRVRYIIEDAGPRKEVYEIPDAALRETIINALSHRDYYDKGACITIELFNDRLEIVNPGGLVSAIPKNEFGSRSHSRNPLIFGLFTRMNMVERIGSGIRRIKDLMKEANLAEPTFSFDGMFIVKLARPKPKTIEGAIEGATKGVKRKLTILLTAIVKNERERIPYYAEITGLSAKSIERYIRQLRNANLIDFDGDATQLGGYFLTEKLKDIIKSSK